MSTLFSRLRCAIRTINPVAGRRRPAPARKGRVRLALEALEDRAVPTVVFTPQFSGTAVTPPTGTTLAQEEADSLKSPDVVLIFAGSHWTSQQQETTRTTVMTLLASPYLSDLTQYGSDGKAIYYSDWSTTSAPGLTADNKLTPSPSDLRNFITNQITLMGKTSPQSVPSSTAIYFVISDPQDSTTTSGTHGRNDFTSSPVHTAYVGTKGFTASDFDEFTTTFSHELAESMAPGIQMNNPGNLDGDQQICDREPEDFGNGYVYRLSGVRVQAYWSQANSAWVVPDGNSQFVYLALSSGPSNTVFNLAATGDQLSANFNDTFTLDRDPVTQGSRLTLNNQIFSFDPGQLNTIRLLTESGSNTVNIKSVLPGESVTVDSYSSNSNDTVVVGNNGSLRDISGPVNVANSSGGKTALQIQAWADGPADITITNNSVSFLGSATINYTPSSSVSGVTSVTITDAWAANYINAESVSPYAPVTVLGTPFDILYGPAAKEVLFDPWSHTGPHL
ncbi:MAG TPA: hypothetical protein VFE78_20830 [Gemmataceae bacterium]|jgi:hypothetical protein|nr:hypothetical protein [Gemmataceae bacterium]